MRTTTLVILLLLFCSYIHATAQEEYPARYCVTTNLNVRDNPSKKAVKIGLLRKNDTITVYSIAGTPTDPWGAINYNGRCGYVSMRYVSYLEPEIQEPQPTNGKVQKFIERLKPFLVRAWAFVKWILIVLAVFFVFLFGEIIIQLAIYAGFFAAAGAILFSIFGGQASTGAIVGLVVAAVVGLRLLISRTVHFSGNLKISDLFRWLSMLVYYILSSPIYWLNRLEHFLVEPWRMMFRQDWVNDRAKPALRIVLEVLSVILYIATTPLRLLNAIIYNILIHCLTGLYDLLFEVLMPCDEKEGSGNTWRWILMFLYRLLKYPIGHGLLTILESILWTVVDIFIPARTFYHGTDLAACDAITRDPNRNDHLKSTSNWSAGSFLSSTSPNCSWAGRGVYFAISRKLAMGYSDRAGDCRNDPVMIACRVSLGRVINYTLTPSHVYRQAGNGGRHEELNKFCDQHGYTTGEWYNNRGFWEYCLLDWQNHYNDPWRIRPIYVINAKTYLIQHISGGVQHWLFYRKVLENLGIKKRKMTSI